MTPPLTISLRWRLTLFYGALLAVVLLIVGVTAYLALRSSVRATLDASLRDAANVASLRMGWARSDFHWRSMSSIKITRRAQSER